MTHKDHTYVPYGLFFSDNDTWEPIDLDNLGGHIMCVRPEDRDKFDESGYRLPFRYADDEEVPYFNLNLNEVIKFYLENNQHKVPRITR